MEIRGMEIAQRDARGRKLLGSPVFSGAEAERLAKENEKELPDGWGK